MNRDVVIEAHCSHGKEIIMASVSDVDALSLRRHSRWYKH